MSASGADIGVFGLPDSSVPLSGAALLVHDFARDRCSEHRYGRRKDSWLSRVSRGALRLRGRAPGRLDHCPAHGAAARRAERAGRHGRREFAHGLRSACLRTQGWYRRVVALRHSRLQGVPSSSIPMGTRLRCAMSKPCRVAAISRPIRIALINCAPAPTRLYRKTRSLSLRRLLFRFARHVRLVGKAAKIAFDAQGAFWISRHTDIASEQYQPMMRMPA